MKKRLILAATLAAAGLIQANAALLVRELFDGLTPSLDGAGDSSTSVGFEPSTTWAANLNRQHQSGRQLQRRSQHHQ